MEAVQRNDENKPKLELVRSHVVSDGNRCPLCDLVHKICTCSEFKIRPTRLKDITLLCLGSVSSGESRHIAPVMLRSRTGQGQTFSTNPLVLKNLF